MYTEMMSAVTVGAEREERGTVTAENTARAVGSGSLAVLATPAMLALMERAAVNLLATMLPEGWTSVGTSLKVSHSSATPIGMGVRALAAITAVEGRTVRFDVAACDEAGEIGRGTHERVVVQGERFLAKAQSKLAEF